MKNIFYITLISVLTLMSCTPLDDTYADLDNTNPNKTEAVGDAELLLNEEDYKALKLTTNYFNSEDDAKQLLPDFLANKYDFWTKGSSVIVDFNVSNGAGSVAYELTESDYSNLGVNYLDSESQIVDFLKSKYSEPSLRDLVKLTYKSNPDFTEYTLTNADYSFVGNGKYKNFDIREGRGEEKEDVRVSKISRILLNNFTDVSVGSIYKVTYKVYDGSAYMMSSFVKLEENSVEATDYTLTDADYDLVGNGKYKNFDVRSGKDEEKIEARIAKISTILKNNFSSATEGQVYNVSYAYYDGNAKVGSLKVILKDGEWMFFSAKSYKSYTLTPVDKTSLYVYTGKWEKPLVLTKEDYASFGSKYGNFSGRNEAQKMEAYRIIENFLANKFPYVASNTLKNVQVKFYKGSGVTDIENPSFVFENNKWNFVKAFTSTKLQFGFDGATWVPDNTIKYTLTSADFELVGNGKYKNFDVRPGKDEEKESVRIEKISQILLNNFPNAEEGQKYLVTYAIYNGSSGTMTAKVVKKGDKYVLFTE